MSTLLDSLTALAGPAVPQIAARLGETDAAVSRAIPTSLASVLGGLTRKATDPGSLAQIFGLVSTHPASADVIADVQGAATDLTVDGPSLDGETFLTTLFDGRMSAVGDLITRTVRFEHPESGSSLLATAAPLVLAFLAKEVRDNGLDVSGLSNLLADERDDIVAATPPGLLNFVNNSTAAPDPFDVLRAKIAARTPTYQPATARHGGRWMWPAAGVAAVALSWFVVTRWRGRDENPVTGVFDSPVSEAGSALRASAGEVGGTFGSLGTLVTRKLRDGIALSIPERGIESKLIAFIEDHTRPVSDTAWFNFDRLSFAKDSATILPESQEQLNNIAAVLEAYPDVNVKVGGYADNVGGAAANLQLSQRRADAVRQALIDRKVAASRIQSEGYGETHPLAPNSTEAGRALNRRIALRVTKK